MNCPTRKTISAETIDAILPQTQCGLCGYDGCMPYARGLVNENASIDLCPPGGVKGLLAIANLLHEDPQPFIPAMEKKAKPKSIAFIREAECIGCTKCIQACPVDAILGSTKLMHTVITDECTGCELCIAPCPVDCIDMLIPVNDTTLVEKQKADTARKRFQSRQQRLEKEQKTFSAAKNLPEKNEIENKKKFIEAALLRVQNKKLSHT
jgi:electron transport complex protein RnfB